MKTIPILLTFLAASACAPGTTAQTTTGPNPAFEQKVLAAETAYEGVLDVAIAYNKRPPCTTPPTVIVCRDPTIVAALRAGNHAVMAGFVIAMNVAKTPGVSEVDVTSALAAAAQAVSQFQSTLAKAK